MFFYISVFASYFQCAGVFLDEWFPEKIIMQKEKGGQIPPAFSKVVMLFVNTCNRFLWRLRFLFSLPPGDAPMIPIRSGSPP
jgi:hypothetical protein